MAPAAPEPAAPTPDRIPVAVLTGFLGSGKTTLLNRLLKLPALADTAIIVNEFGAIGIDHLLVERAVEQPILLANGCLCCTARGDLQETLDQLRRRRARGEIAPFRQVVIETTGLAEPAPILHTLVTDPDVACAYALDGLVATIDAVNGARTLDRHEEARRQVAVADRLVITKTDLAGIDAAALTARLRALNPGAPIEHAATVALGADLVFGGGVLDPRSRHFDAERWLRAGAYDTDPAHDHRHRDDRIDSFCLVRDRPIDWDGFKLWLAALTALRGERLLRVKGFVAVTASPDRPFLVQGVQHIFDPPVQLPAWPSADRRTRLVFITQGLSRDVVAETLAVWDDFTVQG
jgi:G3E family GTPase